VSLRPFVRRHMLESLYRDSVMITEVEHKKRLGGGKFGIYSFSLIFLITSVTTMANPNSANAQERMLHDCINGYDRDRNCEKLKECLLAIEGLDQSTLLRAVANGSYDPLVRVYILDLLGCVQLSLDTGERIVEVFRQIKAKLLKSEIARVLGTFCNAEELEDLKLFVQDYEAQRKQLWILAEKYPVSRKWVDQMRVYPMWSLEQYKYTSLPHTQMADDEDSKILRDLINNFIILFNLHESMWRVEAKKEEAVFAELGHRQKAKCFSANQQNPNRFIRLFLLRYSLCHDGRYPVETLWDPSDVIFAKAYLETLTDNRACRHLELMADKMGDLYCTFGLREDLPDIVKHSGAAEIPFGWQASELVPYFKAFFEQCGDIRGWLTRYIGTHTEHPAKTMLLDVLYSRVLYERVYSAGRDSTERQVLKLIGELSRRKTEHPSVRRKAKEILKWLE
jgi:hypothetical protein